MTAASKFKINAQSSDIQSGLTKWLKAQQKVQDLPKRDSMRRNWYQKNSEEWLVSQGFLGAQVQASNQKLENKKSQWMISINNEQRYSINAIKIEWNPSTRKPQSLTPTVIPILSKQRLKKGEPIDANTIIEMQTSLKNWINERHCFWNIKVQHEILIRSSKSVADVIFKIEAEPTKYLGDIEFKGIEKIDPRYLEQRVDTLLPSCFNSVSLDQMRVDLLRTGLISAVDLEIRESPANLTSTIKQETVDLNIKITERKPRTIELGIGYNTDDKTFLTGLWNHKNWLSSGETLEVTSFLSQLKQNAEISMILPEFSTAFGWKENYLNEGIVQFSSLVERENTDNYESKSLITSASYAWPWNENWDISIGTRFTLSRVLDISLEEEQTFGLLSFPFILIRDSRSDPLNPSSGSFFRYLIEPFFDTASNVSEFLKQEIEHRAYWQVPNKENWILANRILIGTLAGAANNDIPADQRFYLGGGGSIRGFPYQSLGPQTDENKSNGGRGLIEGAVELRHQISKNWGWVSFVDWGYLDEDTFPEEYKLSWAVGFGGRYFMDFAPIRFDIAFPQSDRDIVDSKFQIYLSIGQAY
ncbi:MAG: BamA/TamA family outer membrane protein [Pseudomonadota bacterium]